ncbi:MAG: TldD/PmbA family protein [Calditrichaceae bacterium]|nr:TldD/PmbA family protein [Calditrichaceae bacterium]RQV96800.1 MAG: TldD/PmbA family protein [Calditrichota bacterium]
MNNKERMDLAKWVMEYTLKAGAGETSISVSNAREIEIGYRDRKLEKLKESTQNSLSLQIYIDNRYSGHTTNDLRRDRLKPFIEEAVASTKYLAKDEFRKLPDPKLYPAKISGDLDLTDKSFNSVQTDARIKIAKEIEESAMGLSDKIISVSTGYGDSYSESVLVNSNGFEGSSESTIFSAGAEVTVRDGDKGRPEDYDWAVTRFYNDLPKPNILGKNAVERALKKIGQKKIESGQYKMLVENRAASRLLGILQGPLSARALQQKSSYLEGMLDKKIASEKLTIIDDPGIKQGLGSREFDGEGIASKKRVIIDKGILKQYYIDNYYGRKLGMEPNGGSSSNVIFEYGTRSLDEMIKSMNKGILVNGFIGGNSNSTTGDFSFGIVGLLIENGEITTAVNEMNISGNAKDFWNRLVEMGNDPYPYSSWKRPSMLFDSIAFSGI